MPDPSCSATVEACSTANSIPDSCNFTPLSVTIANLAMDCGVYCGRMSVGMHSGCVAAVNPIQLTPLAPQTQEEAAACMKQRLIGTRWDCAPEEGWVSIYLGSCTVAR